MRVEIGRIAKVTSGLHNLFPGMQNPCKIKFWEIIVSCAKPEVNFTNIIQTGIYSYKGN